MPNLRIGSLFSGIGGLEYGLERSGIGHTIWQVEIDPFCQRVLAKHWPGVARYEDVRSVGSANLPPVELICGGFPCTDVSAAGKGAGVVEGTRSGLWFEYRRIVSEMRPEWVVVENVSSGARRWLPIVRRQLCELGYDSSAVSLSAADVGAPHLRRRIFVIAHSNGHELREQHGRLEWPSGQGTPLPANDGQAQGWDTRPEFCRVDDGVSRRLDGARLKALGNAVVPQCAEVIGRMIANA